MLGKEKCFDDAIWMQNKGQKFVRVEMLSERKREREREKGSKE